MLNKLLSKIIKNSITIIFAIIIFWLTLMSFFTVCYMNTNEHTYFVASSVSDCLIKLSAVFLAFVAYYFAKKKFSTDISEKKERVIEYSLLGVIFIINLVLVLLLRSNAVSDQFEVVNAAVGLFKGDYSAFEQGGYISYYTVQMGLVVVHYIMTALFGEYNYLAFQIVSVMAVTLTWKQLYDIARIMKISVFDRIILLIVGVIFLPYSIYSSFVYGTVLGFMLAISAIKYELKFLEYQKLKDAVVAAVLIAVSILVKSNYLIFLVGMLALLVTWVIEKNKKEVYLKGLLVAGLILIMYIAQSVFVKGFIEYKSGQKMDKSMASIAWLEMGLQEGNRAPGWYNAYNYNTYFEADCNPLAQTERVKGDLKYTISEMLSHKGDTLAFFARKTASQWVNPSFQSIWAVQQTSSVKKNRSTIVERLISPRGNIIFTSLYSVFEFMFLASAFVYCLLKLTSVFKRKSEQESECDDNDLSRLSEFVLEIIFFGGFLFYFFWEAKGQYTIVYMVMISILALKGLDVTEISLKDNKKTLAGVGIAIAFIMALSVISPKVRGLFRMNYDAEAYNAYNMFFFEKNSEYDNKWISDGITLSPVNNKEVCLVNDGEILCLTDKASKADESGKQTSNALTIKEYGSAIKIMMSGKRELKSYLIEGGGYNVEAGTKGMGDGSFWKFVPLSDGSGYRILNFDGYALSYNEENGCVYMSERDDSLSQKWLVK